MRTVGVLVVTYNQYRVTKSFLENFVLLFEKEFIRLLILDNNSKDDTYEKLCTQFPGVDIRKLNDNYGCVTGRNIGIVELLALGCDYVLILDNDMRIEDPDFFGKMLHFMENNPQVDGCCPIMRWGASRTIQTLGRRFNRIGFPRNIAALSTNKRIDILPGGAQFVKSSAFKKFGLYDNDLSPLSIEDYEWSIRAKRKGAEFRFNPEVEVFHYRSRASTPREYVAHGITGRLVFLRKYFNFVNFVRAIVYIIKTTLDYGTRFTARHSIVGISRSIHKGNFDYDEFSCQDLRIYYVQSR